MKKSKIIYLAVIIGIISCYKCSNGEKKNSPNENQNTKDSINNEARTKLSPSDISKLPVKKYTFNIPGKKSKTQLDTGTQIHNQVRMESIANSNTWNSCSVNQPMKLQELHSGFQKFSYILDEQNQANATILGIINIKFTKNLKIAVVDFVQYKDTFCTYGSAIPNDSTQTRIGVGVRLKLTISSHDAKVDVNDPAKVAAGGELNMAGVNFKIETFGFAGDQFRSIIAGLGGSFDVNSYLNVMDAVSKIAGLMKDTMTVYPIRIPYQQEEGL